MTDLNATLASLTYRGNQDVNGIAADTLTVATSDLGNNGAGGTQSDSDTVQINLTAVNDTPVVTAPGSTLSATEQVGLNVHGAGFSISDVDAASGILTATLTWSNGDLAVSVGNSGVTLGASTATSQVLNGTLAQLNNLVAGTGTGTIVYTNNSDTPPASTTLTLLVNDGGNTGIDPLLTADGTSEEHSAAQSITITAVNDAPTVATNLGLNVNEGSSANIISTAQLNEGDPDDSGTGLTYTISAATSNGTLRNNGTALGLNDTFTQADIDANLVTYDHNGSETTTDSFQFSLADGGEDSVAAATGTFSISVTAQNDAPTHTVPGTQTVNEDTTTSISGISVNDPDALGDNISTQLSVSNGILNVTTSGSATISAGSNGSASLTILGSQSDVNATLASLTYRGNQDVNGTAADSLSISTSDLGNNGAGGAQTDSDNVQINITAVNDTPVVSAPGSILTATEQVGLNIHGSGYSVNDVDAAAGVLTATFTWTNGDLVVTAGNSGVTLGASTATSQVFTGTQAQLNNLLTGVGTGSIVYTNNSDTPAASTTLTLLVNDGGNTGTDPLLTGDGSSEEHSAAQTISITAVNDARPWRLTSA